MRFVPLVLTVACGCAVMTGAHGQALQNDQDRTLYAVGLVLGDQIKAFNLTAAEMATVSAGFADAALGRDPKVDLQVFGPRIQALAQERVAAAASEEKQAATEYIARMAQEPGAQRTASGVVVIPVTAGTGVAPLASNTVRVHYHGTLRDGSVFDSSVERGEPISFPLEGVIPCWTEGVQLMKVGGKAKIVCPPETAYGDTGSGSIPGGAALMFEVELLAIE